MTTACPKCNSARWMTGLKGDNFVTVVSSGDNRDFWSSGNPKGFSYLLANVCADCGYTEFYAAQPEIVWAEWQKQKAKTP